MEQAYIDSVDEKQFPHETGKGMKVLVSEEFDLALVGDRERFIGVYRELLIGLVVREGVMEELTESLKRKRGDGRSGDSTDEDHTDGTEWTDDGSDMNEEAPAASQESVKAQKGSRRPRLSC